MKKQDCKACAGTVGDHSQFCPAFGERMIPFYVASKTKHAPKWIEMREFGYSITSTWIDEVGEGESNFAELSQRCLKEIVQSDFLLLYCEPGEKLKGALIESGMALALGKQVRCVGECESLSRVFVDHPLWKKYRSIAEALNRYEYLK